MPLDGIAGHREIIATLETELMRRPSHAYLLCGPAGIGKSIVAAGLAHSLLCERSPGPGFCCTPDQCPVRQSAEAGPRPRNAPAPARCECCPACVQVALGVHPDFIRVARDKNRTDVLIEQVRNLIERLGTRPARGPRRVAIIDDAETLNLPAQNALLKTLEEPPGHTIILLVASSERALLDTMRSRMRAVRFAPLEAADIAAVLEARGKVAPERAAAIARLARGSLARAFALADGAEPPVKELLEGLARAKTLDFAAANAIAQNLFANRDQAVENFELIARLLEEMLCFKLLRAEFNAPSPETGRTMTELAERLSSDTIAGLLDLALKAAAKTDAMATSRLQAERWWMAAGAALRGK